GGITSQTSSADTTTNSASVSERRTTVELRRTVRMVAPAPEPPSERPGMGTLPVAIGWDLSYSALTTEMRRCASRDAGQLMMCLCEYYCRSELHHVIELGQEHPNV